MARSQWMICLGDNGWQIVQMSSAGIVVHDAQCVEKMDPEEQAAQIAEAITEQGFAKEPILLALSSSWCLAAKLPVESPQQIRQRQTMLYQLEESLPWEAEEMVADFVGHDCDAFAVAVKCSQLKPWIDALESHRLIIESVVPMVLLGLAHHLSHGSWPSSHAVLWSHDDSLELIIVQDGKPQDWRAVPPSPTTLAQVLKVLALERTQQLPVVCYQVDDELIGALRELPDVEILDTEYDERTTLEAASAETAQSTLTGKHEPWIELRRDGLAAQDRFRMLRGRIRVAVVAAALLCIALGASFLVRAHRYDVQAERATRQITEIYRDVYSQGSIPPGIRSRLESELAKLKGLSGDSAELPKSPAALDVLYQMLASLPNGLRYRVLEVRIDHGRLDVNGEVRDHGDSDKITTSLREHGFDVSPPSTQRQSPKSVAVRITAHRQAQQKPTEKDPS